jgi:alkylation response protein AidB-like acyl-CoA dehydrogenase
MAELDQWLAQHWDPHLPLRRWWDLLGRSGWANPHWPVEWFGKGFTPGAAAQVRRAIRDFGAVAGPSGFGTNMGGPTLLAHGTDDQKRRHLPGMVTGAVALCQLFSEPNAGSDLASLRTRAERDGDEWVVNGQKVWTSRANVADKGLLVARTDMDVPKHAGLSYFIVDLRQNGVEIRPLREMTGRSHFNEVFLTDVRVPVADLVGGEGNGWTVANTTLGFERALSSGPTGDVAVPDPGEANGNLDRPAGEFVGLRSSANGATIAPAAYDQLLAAARSAGRMADPLVRDALARLYSLERVSTLTDDRARSLRANGGDLAGLANLGKMSQNHVMRLRRDLTFTILGATGMLHAYDADTAAILSASTPVPDHVDLVGAALWAQAAPIFGGSDQIQRTIVGERVLGLPREAAPDRGVPFRDVPKN